MKQIDLLKQVLTKLNIKAVFIFVLLLSIFNTTQAQEVILTSGDNASGSGGTASYSVGQIVQNTITGTNGSAIQGIQFYFESSTLTITDFETNLNISTYPNPTSSFLNIKVQGNQENQENTLSYKLFNILGELLVSGDIKNNAAEINVEQLPSATYLLRVSNSNNITKTYKIIKN
ncbi:MAG: T9SS type A sorting domain-containing protein [Flavobacteriaceae bacterium]|nr:T9SS type A sorting domain-containing protein [Flavobacteriaceae bacterium]